MLQLITGQIWKIATGVSTAALIALSAFTYSEWRENQRLDAKATQLTVEIARATADRDSLRGSIERQTAAFRERAAEDARNTAELAAQLERLQSENRTLTEQARRLLSRPPQGNTECERLLDVDARVLETLK